MSSSSNLKSRLLREGFRHTFRASRKMPGMSLTVLLSVAIGIGVLTATFTIGYITTLTPLPYPAPGQLMVVTSEINASQNPVSAADFLDWREQNHTFQHMTAMAGDTFNLSTGDQPENIQGMRATPGYYNELGGPAAFLMGRDFLPEEGTPGKGHVVILAHALWQRLGGNPQIIGSSIWIDGEPYTVVGVTRGGFVDTRAGEITVPLVFTPEQNNHGYHWLQVHGRLKPGVTQVQAQADLDSIAANLARAFPKTNQGFGVLLTPLQKVPERARTTFWLIFTAVGFVLLMICVNIANLLLARGLSRKKEVAIRIALGATRWTIFVQMISESLALAIPGGMLGLALDYALLRYAIHMDPEFALAANQASPHINLIALVFTIAVTTLSGMFFGYAPAWFAARVDPNEALKDGHSGTSLVRQRLRRILVCGQFALALSLLAGAGFAMESFRNRIHAEVGIRTDHILTFSMRVPDNRPSEPAQILAYYRRIVTSIQSVAGVSSIGISTGNPLFGDIFGMAFTVEGRPAPSNPSQRPSASLNLVTPEYFSTFGIPVERGRAFDENDMADGVRVAIVNENFAKRYLDGADPLKQKISMEQLVPGVARLGPAVDWRIVGVTRNVRGFQKEDSPEILIPFAQIPWPVTTIAVRTAIDPAAVSKRVASAIHSVDSVIALRNMETMDQTRAQATRGTRDAMIACMIFAGAALLLATIGIYGVMSFAVAQRSSEISVRLALGADRGRIIFMILKEGALLACIGLAIGLCGAYFIGRGMQSVLFDVAKIDYPVLAGVSVLLLLAALAACLLPAKKAASVDPMGALKSL
ncbi:ABC transporter permease [Acidicapsa dinghuensis]|uniref:ABC transporter permease n=1 Tax=Acidicapsa dinghuensis TaxID=2218256 RepID=A0ABW1EGS1_9BACT|nr:ABC transporter permease [Acidicapsa dinghuensis]